MMRSRLLVILNPAAGQDEPGQCRETIENYLKKAGAAFEIRLTEGAGDALEWTRTAEGFDRILVGGGDGTVMEALSGSIQNPRPVPLAQLPLGTANLLARALGIPTDLESALELAVAGGVVVSLDVGYLPDHDRYFALVAGSGWDAQLIEDASREMKDRLGFFAYVVTGISNLFKLKPSRVRLSIDGKTSRFRAYSVMVLNVGEIHGQGIALGKNVSPHDGKLDIAIASPRSVWGIFRLLFRLLTGQFDGSRELRYFTAESIEIEARPPMKLEIDGESIGETPFRVEVVPAGARLVVSTEYAESRDITSDKVTAVSTADASS